MATGTLFFLPIARVGDPNNTPVSGAKAYFYQAGTLTPAAVYSDVLLTTQITQPVVANSAGIFQEIFLTPGQSYKVDIQTSAGVSLSGYPADNIAAIPVSSGSTDILAVAGEALTAGNTGFCYLSDGSGGKVAGSWYKCDSTNTYSSTTPVIGCVPNDIANGATGTVRIAGRITGLSGLTPGANYYVSTSGAITATAPANGRLVGQADSTTTLILTPDPSVATLYAPTIISPTIQTSISTPSALFTGLCQGRLTLTSGTAVTTSDVTGATNVYFTPYGGNNIALYDGSSKWTLLPFVETTLPLGTLTSGLPYDVFGYNNNGTLALESLAWSSGTARATALVLQNGVLVKTGATTRRYLGTFYTTSTTQTEDSAQNRYLWNFYNRVPRRLNRFEGTASWNYTTATIRQANGSTSNQVNVVIGVAESAVALLLAVVCSNSAGGAFNAQAAIGYDVTNAFTASQGMQVGNNGSGSYTNVGSVFTHYPAVGQHFYAWNEYSAASGTTTWYGTNPVAGSTASGLSGTIVN